MRKCIVAAVIGLFVIAGTLPAAGGGADKRKLTLDECVEMGINTSKLLRASEMKAEAFLAKSREARADRLPSLKAFAGYTRLSEVPPFEVHLPFSSIAGIQIPGSFIVSPNYYDNYSLRLSLQQPLFTGFRLRSGAEIAEWNYRAVREDQAGDRRELVFAVRSAYWNLYKAREIRRAVEETASQVKAHLTDVRNFFELGLSTQNDVLRVDVELSNVEMARLDADDAVTAAALRLNNLTGLPLDTEVEPGTDVEENAAAAQADSGGESLEELLSRADRQRPELRSLSFRIKAGESGVTLAKSGWYPQVFFSGNYYDSRPNPRLMPAKDEFYSTWDLSLSVSLDLWNWGKALRQTQQARALLAQAEAALGQMKDAVAVEVRQAQLALERSKAKILVSRRAVVQAEENFRVTREKFKEGVALNADVLDAEAALLQAKTGRIRSLVDLELARAKLDRVTGK
jgi:outer membrane protein